MAKKTKHKNKVLDSWKLPIEYKWKNKQKKKYLYIRVMSGKNGNFINFKLNRGSLNIGENIEILKKVRDKIDEIIENSKNGKYEKQEQDTPHMEHMQQLQRQLNNQKDFNKKIMAKLEKLDGE